jgi:hypothetical protein
MQGSENTFSFADPARPSYAAKLDGTETAFKGDLSKTVVSVKRIDGNVIEETDNREGKVVQIVRFTVSIDGKNDARFHRELKWMALLSTSCRANNTLAWSSHSERLAHDDFAFANEKLRRTMLRAANDWHQTVDLPTRNQPQHAARRASEHGPVRIFLLADFAGILQNENCSGLHLFGNPFIQNVEFGDHCAPPGNRRLPKKRF